MGENANEEEFKYNEVAMGERKYKNLICIAGNHELTFQVDWYDTDSSARRYHKLSKQNAKEIKNIVVKSSAWIYLEDTSYCLYGLNFYGAPWQPYFYNWAFQLSRGDELDEKWKKIP